MAKYSGHHPALREALRAMGIEPNDTRRVVIDIQNGGVPIVHIERFVDDKVIDVVRTLAGIEIHREDKTMDTTNHGDNEGDD